MRRAVIAMFLLSMAALPAQRTWTVDLLNRPGTDFLDLPAAVAAAAPGDVLRVRWVDLSLRQYYLLPTIRRGLTILGEGVGPTCMGALRVIGLPHGERVVVNRLRMGTATSHVTVPPTSGLVVQDCLGTVVLRDCTFHGSVDLNPVGFIAERNVLLWLQGCTMEQGPSDDVTIRDTMLVAEGAAFMPDPYRGVVMYCARSDVWLVDSVVQGAPPGQFLPYGGWAIASCNSTFHLAGNSRVVSGDPIRTSGIGTWGVCPYNETVFLDPRSQVTGVPPFTSLTVAPIPAQVFTLDTRRTTLTTTTYGHANCLVLQAWALAPTAPQPIPIGIMFLDPLASILVDLGLLDPSGRRIRSYPIPPGLPPEMTLALQSVELTPAGTLQLGNVSLPNLW